MESVQGYRIDVTPDGEHKNAVAITWHRQAPSAEKDRQRGIDCLRSNMPDWSEEQLGACPRIENLLRKSPCGQIPRSFSLNGATIRLK
ncbi:MAG: hypothetical protein CTY19_09890 [Methylomonas sp.]|nr:MAG: hypothetical protein CTY19_09890 [Methylomonas sp.]